MNQLCTNQKGTKHWETPSFSTQQIGNLDESGQSKACLPHYQG